MGGRNFSAIYQYGRGIDSEPSNKTIQLGKIHGVSIQKPSPDQNTVIIKIVKNAAMETK